MSQRRPDPAPAAEPARLPPQATMGLLDYLTAHAVDEDYAFVAERDRAARAAGGDDTPARRRRVGPLGAVAVACVAVLVVAAGVQNSRSAAADDRDRRELAGQVSRAREQLETERVRLAALQRETDRLQARQLASDESATGIRNRIQSLGARAGTLAVTGPGVRVVADDAPGSTTDRTTVLDSDLQRLVNGFWEAGAEAIAINGQRLTNLSTIRVAGGAITVNARSLRAPYVLQVVGNPDTLPARFAETTSGQAWLDLERQVGLQLTITPRDDLRLPASEVTLRYVDQVAQARDRAGQEGTP
ncbi:DUF881 domain-containing protein [Nocardioides aurantiacus]|uniref:Uncharacterized protein YlxW (UPF0749 family) n=1 Tax=Nocardioides aurantiacus TaxID=86796 RepID=A0A3N2CTD8_9ACTN|nr:DUF881 domain-containing protein [Nocardioides aurantiacus]ROR90797.1 uncharacterized protein YlxW (UPF0749 family) [Nocardioides aurantiacus]